MGKATLIATIVCLGTLAAFVWFSEPTMSSLEVKHAQQGANLANSQQIHAQGSVGSNCCPQFLPVGYNSNNLLAQNAFYGYPYGIHSLDGRYGDYSSYLSGSNIVGAPGYSIQGLSGNQVIDLSNAQLSGTHLSGAHLSGAHLSGAHLSGAHFAGSPVGLSSQTISSSGISGLNQGVTVTGPAGASQSGGVTVITTRPVTSSSASGTQVIEGGQGHGLNVHTISGGISSSGSASIQGGSGRSFSEGGSGVYTGRAGVNLHQGYNVYGLHGLQGVRTNVVNVPVHVPVRAGSISAGAVAGAASSVGGIAGYTHGVRTNVVNVPVPVPVRVGSVAASAGAAARGGSVSGGSVSGGSFSGGSSSSGSVSGGSVSGGSSSSSSSSSSEGSSFEGGSGSTQSGSFSYNLGGYSGESSSSSGGSDSRTIENVWSNSTVYQNHILNPYSSNGGSSGGSSSSSSSSSDRDKDKDD